MFLGHYLIIQTNIAFILFKESSLFWNKGIMLRFYSANTSDKVSGQIFCIGVRHSSDTCRQICLQIESMIVIAKRANGMYKTKFSVRIDNVLLFSFM